MTTFFLPAMKPALYGLLIVGASAGLNWTRNTIPLTGELVLTDIHATLDSTTDTIIALATGEAGVVLKLNTSVSRTLGGVWTTLLDTSFPTYWYGAYVFNVTSYLLSGFIDGGGKSFGIVAFSYDAGVTWSNDSVIDPTNWGGGPIEFANDTEGYMPSTSGASAWRTQTGGRSASAWVEITPSPGNWHAGDYVYNRSGYISIAGSSDCSSTDFGSTWSCGAPVDASGIDSGKACAQQLCVVGGGEISPAVAGWTHVSTDGGKSWGSERALNAAFPIRSVLAIPTARVRVFQ